MKESDSVAAAPDMEAAEPCALGSMRRTNVLGTAAER